MFNIDRHTGSLHRAVSSVALSLCLLSISACVSVERVTVDSNGGTSPEDHKISDVSHDGRYVVFTSAGILDVQDTNSFIDVYIRDTLLNTTELVSKTYNGGPTNSTSYYPKVSDDGRYIVYQSDASNITPLGFDTNFKSDVFLYDRQSGSTISITWGSQTWPTAMWNERSILPDISADGSLVVFESRASDGVPNDTNNFDDVFSYDVATGAIKRVSVSNTEQQANRRSGDPSVSDNGDFIAFTSEATNLTSFTDTNGEADVFVRALDTSTFKVSTAHDGAQLNGPSFSSYISGLGGRIAFDSRATNVMPGGDGNGTEKDVYVAELITGNVWQVSVDDNGVQYADSSAAQGIDHAGQRILFRQDQQLWVRDLERTATDRAARTMFDNPDPVNTFRGTISGSGNYVAFSSQLSAMPGNDLGNYEGYLVAYPQPEVLLVSSSVQRGTSTNVTISGEKFEPGSVVVTDTSANPDVTWSNVTVVNHTTITGTVTVASNAVLGNRDVSVITPDGGPGLASGALGTCKCLVVEP